MLYKSVHFLKSIVTFSKQEQTFFESIISQHNWPSQYRETNVIRIVENNFINEYEIRLFISKGKTNNFVHANLHYFNEDETRYDIAHVWSPRNSLYDEWKHTLFRCNDESLNISFQLQTE